MKLFLITFCVFGVALLGMSLGVIFSDRRIRGSCGGLSNAGGKKLACDACPSGNKYCSGGEHHSDDPAD
jgi:hypothetical protein